MILFLVSICDNGKPESVKQSNQTKTKASIHERVYKKALEERGLMKAFHARPAYQQNDNIGCITRAKRSETTQKQLDQMLSELERGGVYMKMAHAASRR